MSLAHPSIYIQRDWTDQALLADGFLSYCPVKCITMARLPSPDETLKTIKVGCWIAYVMDKTLKQKGDGYKLRLIEPNIFAKSYKPLNELNWQPTSAEAHLQSLNCQPYYEIASVWAKRLCKPTWVLSRDCDDIFPAPTGTWLCLSAEGKLRTLSEAYFYAHYSLPEHSGFKKSDNDSTTYSKVHLFVTAGSYSKESRI
jgi:hypothetical protein